MQNCSRWVVVDIFFGIAQHYLAVTGRNSLQHFHIELNGSEWERMRANGGCNYLSGDEKSIKWTHHCRVSWRSRALLSIFICYLQHLCSNIVKHNHTPSWFNHTTHLHLPSFTFSLDFRTRFTCLHRCHQICYRLFYYTLARALMSCLSLTFNGFIALDVHLTGFMGLRAPRDVLKQFCVVQRLVFIAFDLKCA